MEVEQIQHEVDAALNGTTGYDDSVARLEKIGIGTNDAMGLASLHHGLSDTSDDDPNWVPADEPVD